MPIEINRKENSDYASRMGKLKARVTFKTLDPPLRAKTSEGWIDRPQTSFSFPATYMRRNGDGSHEVVRYYKNKTTKIKGNAAVDEYTPDFVTIEGGDINLSTVTDKDLVWFLKHHPHNKSNDIYDKEGKHGDTVREIDELVNNRNVPFAFMEVDKKKSSKLTLEAQRKLQSATMIVLAVEGDEDFLDNKQVALLCRAYGMKEVDDCLVVEDFDTLRNALLDQAKVDPDEFIRKLESAALHLEAMVQDAIKLSVIKYDQPDAKDGAWFWDVTTKPITPKQICVIPNANYKEKEEMLVSFLRLDAGGVSVSKRMKDEVQEARKKKQLAA